MAALEAALREIIVSLTNIQASRYTCGAAMTVLFYDFTLTWADEIKHIWARSQRLSAVKLMFIWNRYITMPFIVLSNYHLAALRPAVSNQFCKVAIPVIAISQGISIAIGIQLLALRVLALYKNDPKIRIALFSYLAVCHIATFTIAGVVISRFLPFMMFLPLTNSCYTIPDPLIGYVYVPPLLAEAGIFVLQVINHIQRRRNDSTFQSTLLTTLYRDGYLYFAAVMGIRLLGIFLYAFGPGSLWFISNQLDYSISTALISRFFLQLRGALLDDPDETLIMPLSRRGMFRTPNGHGSGNESFGGNGNGYKDRNGQVTIESFHCGPHPGGGGDRGGDESFHYVAGTAPSAGAASISFGVPIQPVQDFVSSEETYLPLQRLRRLRVPR